MPITIRQYQQEDKETVLALHRAAFERRSRNQYAFFLEELIHELTAGFCVIAADNMDIIGAGMYTPLNKAYPYIDDYSLQESFQRLVTVATDQTKKDALVEYLKYEHGWTDCGEIDVEYFMDEHSSKNILVHEKDFYLSSVVVHLAFRGKGIGTALAKRRIDIAREYGAHAVYASCYESSTSHIILRKQGFLPLLRVRPNGAEESAIIEMRLEL